MNIAARIRAGGEYAGRENGRTKACKVRCQGCGEDIFSDRDLSRVEYVKTKRGSEWFFHRDCMDKVWRRKIV